MKRIRIYYNRKDPPNTKRVCRPAKWGNPYPLWRYSLDESLRLYKIWINKKLEIDPKFLDPLIGYDLGCYCKLEDRCHADIIIDILR